MHDSISTAHGPPYNASLTNSRASQSWATAAVHRSRPPCISSLTNWIASLSSVDLSARHIYNKKENRGQGYINQIGKTRIRHYRSLLLIEEGQLKHARRRKAVALLCEARYRVILSETNAKTGSDSWRSCYIAKLLRHNLQWNKRHGNSIQVPTPPYATFSTLKEFNVS